MYESFLKNYSEFFDSSNCSQLASAVLPFHPFKKTCACAKDDKHKNIKRGKIEKETKKESTKNKKS
jgi:hypothetical protein